MRHLRRLSPGKIAALLTVVVVGAIFVYRGGELFSPGPLSAQTRGRAKLGGVSAHAEIGGHCAACHVAPWSQDTMATRCLGCHTDVGDQIEQHRPLHGRLSEGRNCRACHTEHQGPHGNLTNLANFDHDRAAFRLTGKHQGVDCQRCHKTNVYKGTSQACVSCHAEPQAHKSRYGTACAQCHSTATWSDATFRHKFPLNHGKKHRTIACATCHTMATDFRTYTCYGCHEHRPRKIERKHRRLSIEKLKNCAYCHPTGREHEHRRRDRNKPKRRNG